jgi:hypothetical protein
VVVAGEGSHTIGVKVEFFLHSLRKDGVMAKKKVADLLVDTLAAAGVERVYGVAGDSLDGITDSIRRMDRRASALANCGCEWRKNSRFVQKNEKIADARPLMRALMVNALDHRLRESQSV